MKSKPLSYWLHLYFVRHYKTTIAGLGAIAASLGAIARAVVVWEPAESIPAILGAVVGIATGAGLIASKDAGQSDRPYPAPVEVETTTGTVAAVVQAPAPLPTENE